MAGLAAILGALARVVWRDLRTFSTISGNNFFLVVALIMIGQWQSGLFFIALFGILLLVPLAAALLLLRTNYLPEKDVAILPLGLSLFLLFSNFTPVLKFNLPYLLVLSLILVLWFPDRLLRRTDRAGD